MKVTFGSSCAYLLNIIVALACKQSKWVLTQDLAPAESRVGDLWLVNNDGDYPIDSAEVRIEGVVVRLERELV